MPCASDPSLVLWPNAVPPDLRALCVVMHDVAPATWPKCQQLLAELRRVAPFPATLLVVPHYHNGVLARDDRAFCAALDAARASGDELVLHGLTHLDDGLGTGARERLMRGVYTAGEGEFAGLSEAQARDKLTLGMDWFAAEGWPLSGFVAPAWLLSDGAWSALRNSSLAYTTTLRGLHLLPDGPFLEAQSLVFSVRSRWRRAASHVFAEMLAMTLTQAPLVRIGLHPVDVDHPRVVRHWQRLLARFVETHRPTTKAQLVAEWQGRESAFGLTATEELMAQELD